MRTLALIALLASLLVAPAARAEDAAKLALAEKLLTAMDMQKNIEKSFEAIKGMQMQQMKAMQAGAGNEEKFRAFQDELMKFLSEEISWSKLKNDYVAIYAETFTQEELQALADFYDSPAGRSYAAKMPELMEKSMQISQKQMMTVMPKLQELMRKNMVGPGAQPGLKAPAAP